MAQSTLLESSPDQLLARNLDLVDRLTRYVCRRSGLFGADADDFQGEVHLALVENDYAVLRRFRDESRLPTYLTVVIHNLARDLRTRHLGRWRPSAQAARLGCSAIDLETLIERDGFTRHEAVETVRQRTRSSRAELLALAERLPARVRRRFIPLDRPERLAAGASSDARLLADEQSARQLAATRALARALADLPSEDRLILRMRFASGLRVVAIARALGLDQRALYRRIRRLLERLRLRLAEDGVRRDQALA